MDFWSDLRARLLGIANGDAEAADDRAGSDQPAGGESGPAPVAPEPETMPALGDDAAGSPGDEPTQRGDVAATPGADNGAAGASDAAVSEDEAVSVDGGGTPGDAPPPEQCNPPDAAAGPGEPSDGDPAVSAPAEDSAAALPADAPPSDSPSDSNVAARQERAAGLILDDERLRGDLTDDEFQPLLDWALAASDRAVEAVASDDDDAAMAEIGERVAAIKDAVRLAAEAVAAQVNGDAGQRGGALAALAELAASSGFQAAMPGTSADAVQALASEFAAQETGDGTQAAGMLVRALAAGSAAADSSSDPADASPDPADASPDPELSMS